MPIGEWRKKDNYKSILRGDEDEERREEERSWMERVEERSQMERVEERKGDEGKGERVEER